MFYSHRKIVIQALFMTAWIVQANCLVVCADDLASEQSSKALSEKQLGDREFSPLRDGKWIGQGISYGPYREGESPGGLLPTSEEITEDLKLISKRWNLIRIYGSNEVAEDVLKIIHEKNLPVRVMLGAWISCETASETLSAGDAQSATRSNQEEVAQSVRLANAYPEEVIAVSVGNETQVYWSGHRTDPELLIRYIRAVREGTSVPVTTADDFNFWNKPESKAVAAEVDFIVTHVHAMWAGLLPSTAMQWTEEIYDQVCAYHPKKMVVIGEAGWATQVHNEGEQAKLIKGEASEAAQQLYYQRFTDWAEKEKICTFFFEAFDESWKGGPHPDEVEKHWGLFNINRTPKAAMSNLD